MTTTVRYRVIVGLDYATNMAAIRRILAGEDVPWEERRTRRAEPGDIVSDLPAHSIPALIEKGYIEAVSGAATATAETEVTGGG